MSVAELPTPNALTNTLSRFRHSVGFCITRRRSLKESWRTSDDIGLIQESHSFKCNASPKVEYSTREVGLTSLLSRSSVAARQFIICGEVVSELMET
jgi:hypothetical protein